MRVSWFLLFLLMSVFLLSGCSLTSAIRSDGLTAKPLVAKPLQPSAQQQLAVKRLSDILTHVDLTEEQQAEIYFQRAIRYDAMGLLHLAHFDFNQALKLKSDIAEAYNYLGIYYTLEQEYASAYDAFDSVQEINSEHTFSYLNRGIALYYGKRFELAVTDFSHFFSAKPTDPYAAIWLFLAETEIDPKAAKQTLLKNRTQVEQSQWAVNIIDLYTGRIPVSQFYRSLLQGVSSETELAQQLCEAYFYLAKYFLMQNDKAQADVYFKLALANNVYEYVEHRYAQLELNKLVTVNVNQAVDAE